MQDAERRKQLALFSERERRETERGAHLNGALFSRDGGNRPERIPSSNSPGRSAPGSAGKKGIIIVYTLKV